MTVSLQIGWGFFPQGQKMRLMFDNTQNTTFGGPFLGVQALFPVPWLWDYLTLGVDGWYHKVTKRYLADKASVFYADTQERVTFDESVYGFGIAGVGDIVIVPAVHLQLGGGYVYLSPENINVVREVSGLFPKTFEPAAFAALDVLVSRYESGSIDVYLRYVREFGDFNNTFIQATLGFNFRL